jgi:hypothetical protein
MTAVEHVPRPFASRAGHPRRLDYRRRVPFAPRVTTFSFVGLVASLALGSVFLVGCGSHHAATGFCATIRRGHSAFNSTDEPHAKQALAEFDRVVAAAPAAVAPDLHTVSAFLHTLYRNPAAIAKNPSLLKQYSAATGRVDRYLHRTCGISIPPPSKFI